MPQQRRLPLIIPRAYDRGERGLTLPQVYQRAWATEVIEAGLFRDDARTIQFEKRLRALHYDEALVCGQWRLELLYISTGLPHFRLYWRSYCFGVADIHTSHADLTTSRKMPVVRKMMAAFLVLCGWTDTCIKPARARTRLDANTDHQYRLFKARAISKPAARYDVLRDEKELA